jgi:hypothetical protein
MGACPTFRALLLGRLPPAGATVGAWRPSPGFAIARERVDKVLRVRGTVLCEIMRAQQGDESPVVVSHQAQ